ncbi:MAG: HEAT repeat domain-containing protein [Gemmatimonadota bacterium]
MSIPPTDIPDPESAQAGGREGRVPLPQPSTPGAFDEFGRTHPDPGARLEAAVQLGEQRLFAYLAGSDDHPGVRMEALGRLDDEKLLEEIGKACFHTQVRRAALEKLEDEALLIEVLKEEEDYLMRTWLVERIREPEALLDVAAHDKIASVRDAAAARLGAVFETIEDEDLRRKIVELSSDSPFVLAAARTPGGLKVRIAAIQKLDLKAASSLPFLLDLVRTDPDPFIRAAALEKLGTAPEVQLDRHAVELESLARNDPDRRVREKAEAVAPALARIRKAETRAEKIERRKKAIRTGNLAMGFFLTGLALGCAPLALLAVRMTFRNLSESEKGREWERHVNHRDRSQRSLENRHRRWKSPDWYLPMVTAAYVLGISSFLLAVGFRDLLVGVAPFFDERRWTLLAVPLVMWATATVPVLKDTWRITRMTSGADLLTMKCCPECGAEFTTHRTVTERGWDEPKADGDFPREWERGHYITRCAGCDWKKTGDF